MSAEAFDPYHRWLGIPPAEQPANHYRLLGIGLFETDADVIHDAADRQMAHVQRHKVGKHSALSQQILNELAAAKLCLINPQKKAAYDGALQARQSAPLAAAPPLRSAAPPVGAVRPPLQATVVPTAPYRPIAAANLPDDSPQFEFGEAPSARMRRKSASKSWLMPTVGALFALAVLIIAVLALNQPGNDGAVSHDSKGSGASVTPGKAIVPPPGQTAEPPVRSNTSGKPPAPEQPANVALPGQVQPKVNIAPTSPLEQRLADGDLLTLLRDQALRQGKLPDGFCKGQWGINGRTLAVSADASAPPPWLAFPQAIADEYTLRLDLNCVSDLKRDDELMVGLPLGNGKRFLFYQRFFEVGVNDAIEAPGKVNHNAAMKLLSNKPMHWTFLVARGKLCFVSNGGLVSEGQLDRNNPGVDLEGPPADRLFVGGKGLRMVTQARLMRPIPPESLPRPMVDVAVNVPRDPNVVNLPIGPPNMQRRPPIAMNLQRSPVELMKPPKAQGFPAPSAQDVEHAVDDVKEVLASDYKDVRTPAKKTLLAGKLMETSLRTGRMPERYAMLSEARRLAREAGDPALTIAALESLFKQFAVDRAPMAADDMEEVAKNVSTPSARKSLAEILQKAVGNAVTDEQFDAARRLVDVGQKLSRKTSDPTMIKRFDALKATIAQASKDQEAAKTAADVLVTNPEDPVANATLGKYLAFQRNQWSEAIRFLAKGDDEELKTLAAEEPEANSLDSQVALADAWWEAAEKATGASSRGMFLRAETLYKQCVDRVQEFDQLKIRKRLSELASKTATPGDSPAVSVGPPTSKKSFAVRFRNSMRKSDFGKTQTVGFTRGGSAAQEFTDLPVQAMLLCGFNYTRESANSQGIVSSLQPLYSSATASNTATGSVYGRIGDSAANVVAKKGYAVQNMKIVYVGAVIVGFELTFAKIEPGGLDANDTYTSEWIGEDPANWGGKPVVLGSGQPLVGMYGTAGQSYLYSFGLIELP